MLKTSGTLLEEGKSKEGEPSYQFFSNFSSNIASNRSFLAGDSDTCQKLKIK